MTQNDKSLDDLLADPFTMEQLPQQKPIEAVQSAKPVREMDRLTPEEQQKAQELAKQIPIGQTEAI